MKLTYHFGLRSDFSIGESLLQIGPMIDTAKDMGYKTLALADTMSLHGMMDFSARAKKAGIEPIIGARIRVVKDPLYRKPSKSSGIAPIPNPMFMIKAFVTSEKGLKSLMALLSKANSADYFYYHARVGLNDVLALEDVIITTGDMFGLFSSEDAYEALCKLVAKFGGDKVYSELCPVDTPLFDTMNARAIEMGKAAGTRFITSHPALYKDKEQGVTLDVLNAINANVDMSSPRALKQFYKEFHIAKPEELTVKTKKAVLRLAKFYGITDVSPWGAGLLGMAQAADQCSYRFAKMPVSLPKMAANEFAALCKACLEGWTKRFNGSVLGHQPSPQELVDVYKPRLAYELEVLKKMGFSGYFLLVQEIVQWSKTNGVIVGPGRGSVGGSLVAYLMGITDVDPIRFGLLFERFINPERLDLPDADLDFMSSRRHEVIDYLVGKYGRDYVAGISNFSTLASASAVRDTGRVYGLKGAEMTATKLMPKEHGQSVSLVEAADSVPEIAKFSAENPEIWKHALNLEGVMRSFGQHAAGVVVGGEPLGNRAVVETRGESYVVNWDKRVVEDMGLVKIDVLGLSTLDVLEIAKTYIKERHGKTINYLSLPLDDEKVMKSFGEGQTTGVFQFESGGMKNLLKQLAYGGQLTFEDITAATALYRPGPMDSGLMDDFIQIKQGTKMPFYEHPKMEPALKDTASVIVYQEQVMRLAVDLAGFSGAEADLLRKAMGKKDKDKMAEMRQKWVDGCMRESGMAEANAGALFDKIEKFAGYGFNRSHSVAYTIISYLTMWLRVYYPAEYFAACLSIVKEEKLTGLVKDARECGIEILPPDVNKSTDRFTIPSDGFILAPFSAVKGVSENTAKAIVRLRDAAGGQFADVASFTSAAATKGSKVNKKVVENLIKVGACASIDPTGLPARHLDRRKDQTELMPGLIIDVVKANRTSDMSDKFLKAKIIHIIQEYKACSGCDLAGQPHPIPRLKNNVKFMVVTDCPTWEEEKADKLLMGGPAEALKEAIATAGLAANEGYYTALVKAKKNDKFLSNDQLNGCRQFIEKELDVVKPPVIVALGSAAIKFFLPGLKGSTAELAGKVVYSAERDASIVCGINPAQVHFDPAKAAVLEAVFEKVAEILN